MGRVCVPDQPDSHARAGADGHREVLTPNIRCLLYREFVEDGWALIGVLHLHCVQLVSYVGASMITQ